MTYSAERSFDQGSGPKSVSIFPVPFASLKESLSRLNKDPENILRLVTDARTEGAADDLFVNVVHHNNKMLEEWHRDNRDFTEDGVFHYRLGLLYGIDIAQTISSEQTATPQLKADDPEAFAEAIAYLTDSYRGLDDTKSGWIRQKNRELRMTGSDIITVAYAGLHDRVRSMLEISGINPGINDQAMHVGMVDGLLFVDSYRQLKAGQVPAVFPDAIEQIATYDPKHHMRGTMSDLVVVYSIDSIDEIEQFITDATDVEDSRPIWLKDGRAIGRERFIQIGPNEFTTAFELEAVIKTNSKRQLGFAALTGVLLDSINVYVHEAQSDSLFPVATATAVGITWAVGFAVDKARAKKYSLPIVSEP